jgi:hypothetical protein
MTKGRRKNGDRPENEARGSSPVRCLISIPLLMLEMAGEKAGEKAGEEAPYLHNGIQNMEHVLGSKMAVRVFVQMVNGYDDAGCLCIHHDETCRGGVTGDGRR